MKSTERNDHWSIVCDRETFDKCRSDERFPYIVALARATNALNSVHSFLILTGDEIVPRATRDRLNSYFFASAILYEILNLIKKMSGIFRSCELFERELRPFLKDSTAKQIEQHHLKPIRHQAVFHFDPERFAETIQKATVNDCVFIEGRGERKGDVNYSFADVVASEILVGFAEDSEPFYEVLAQAMANTRNLVVRFIPAVETFIGHHLLEWGFTLHE